jgi:uncharacterized protein YjfI (DUF2170 family)
MLISDLIKKLESKLRTYGDLPVYIIDGSDEVEVAKVYCCEEEKDDIVNVNLPERISIVG